MLNQMMLRKLFVSLCVHALSVFHVFALNVRWLLYNTENIRCSVRIMVATVMWHFKPKSLRSPPSAHTPC